MIKSPNFFKKVQSDSNFVNLDGNFGKLLVGILNCNRFRRVCEETSPTFSRKFDLKLVSLEFGWQFWSTFSGIFRCVCDEKSLLLHESSTQLEFHHFEWQFWSTFTRHEVRKHNFRHICLEKFWKLFWWRFDSTHILPFSMALKMGTFDCKNLGRQFARFLKHAHT